MFLVIFFLNIVNILVNNRHITIKLSFMISFYAYFLVTLRFKKAKSLGKSCTKSIDIGRLKEQIETMIRKYLMHNSPTVELLVKWSFTAINIEEKMSKRKFRYWCNSELTKEEIVKIDDKSNLSRSLVATH